MLLLKIIYEGDSIIVDELQELKGYYKDKNIVLGICESIDENTHFIKILCDDDVYNEKLKSAIQLRVSTILYKIVVSIFKDKELYEILTDSYFFLRSDEIPELSDKIIKGLNGDENIKDETSIYCLNRQNNIIEKIKECIEEKDEINVEGFIRFRMKELLGDFQSIVDKIVETYLVEKEYNEFVKLLKYFVEVQESKIDELHIIIDSSGSYHLENREGKDIMDEFVNELLDCKMGSTINVEDMIISGLITNAPQKIIIHGAENSSNKELIETIKNVFLDRVIICSGCSRCVKTKIKI
ncbi:MAG: putative sporulation protein YtxC [Clostridium cadaveris]|uniref:Putative sporulation protein YtxC n=1 Tax=Clostridium cadaveris TaxID=1529 RepID=A0A316M584_9CLOT|nr:putative sporulation protein YtxC [Clostridium cadaveris]MDY4949527.1 putative sporulation protein YtxC [Clostridium cadaveris]PWL52788.1 MAG: putative sporulation protein YtxC [Clostridium cadaveris]UFH63521.1 putative sporulation protein YtxC [Clostridium cadaveris]